MRSIANTMLQESYLACWDAEGLSWSLCARIWNDWHWWGKLQHYSLARGLLRVFLTSLWHFHNPSLHIHGKATRSHVLRAPWSMSVGNPWGPKAEADKEHLAPQPLPRPWASPAAAGKGSTGWPQVRQGRLLEKSILKSEMTSNRPLLVIADCWSCFYFGFLILQTRHSL